MIVTQSLSIEIAAERRKVFDYIADLRNDKYWRSEVNGTSITGEVQVGAVALEDSRLSPKVPSYLRKLRCTEWVDQTRVVYTSSTDESYFLRTLRTVHDNDRGGTRVCYTLEFDSAVVKVGLGFSLPHTIVNWVTKRAMRRYLRTLKRNLESKC
ncbi:SRPBCC family protein [Sphingobacterium thalpophilum]|uniref:Polyketide cyclase / dehydrase and lipid transport n=1 Tax=Sphingobacterium thalpophilum TaxID=259 RepID=A0A4U9VDY0_9SPHI|nr:SRPBCC family protein [Sphingobacterium thalpophilum]VTR43509.1 Polyketide cyclase / dehydrase and lipid transport [Sphingobacterium thalpophilum]